MGSKEDRLSTLLMYQILETRDERQFDDIVLVASTLCEAPIALVSFLDQDRQWFKARIGFTPEETDLSRSVCRFVVATERPLVIPDLSLDPRTEANPLVTGPEGVRFYAGHPITTRHGVLGSLCVLDTKPRPEGLPPPIMASLAALARLTVDRLEARRVAFNYDMALSVLT